MQILSHRGYWKTESEKNQRMAFQRSFNAGFGTETDLRDADGQIVISHDIPKGGEMTFDEVLQIMNGRNLPLALNIKADGLADLIKDRLTKYNHTNYFTFDMSIPDMIFQIDRQMNVFTGLSDLLNPSVLLDECQGVWLDCFRRDWYGAETLDTLIEQGKKVCIVSADLHKRNTDQQWNIIKQAKSINDANLMLCTDKPEKAKEFFQ